MGLLHASTTKFCNSLVFVIKMKKKSNNIYFVHLIYLSCSFIIFKVIRTTEETLLRNVHQNVIYPDPGYWISTWNSNDWEKCCVWRDLVQSSVSIALLSCHCSMLTEVTQIGRVEAVRGSVPRVGGLNLHGYSYILCVHYIVSGFVCKEKS